MGKERRATFRPVSIFKYKSANLLSPPAPIRGKESWGGILVKLRRSSQAWQVNKHLVKLVSIFSNKKKKKKKKFITSDFNCYYYYSKRQLFGLPCCEPGCQHAATLKVSDPSSCVRSFLFLEAHHCRFPLFFFF